MQSWKLKLLPYSLYLFVVMFYWNDFLFQITPDTISYISIAQHYVDQHYYEAINAYWSPLVSWIMAIFFHFYSFSPIGKIIVFKGLNVLAGLGVLYSFSHIIDCSVTHFLVRFLAKISSALWLALWVLTHITADIIVLLPLLYYVYLIINQQLFKQAYTLGLIGGLLFFSKSYCFFVFLLHYHWCFVRQYILVPNMERKQQLLNYLKTMIVFGLTCSIWIALLSYKYGNLTLSSAGTYNHAMMIDGTLVHRCFLGAILPLPHQYANFFWEDIALTCSYTDWSPLASWQYLKLQLRVIKNNLYTIKSLSFYLIGLTKLVLFISLVVVVNIQKKLAFYVKEIGIFLSIYLLGYALLEVQDRFLWLLILCTIWLIALYVDKLLSIWGDVLLLKQKILLVLGWLYFLNFSTYEQLYQPHWAIDGYEAWQEMSGCSNFVGSNMVAYDTNDKIPWYICYYADNRYWGGIKNLMNQPIELETSLKKYNINYILLPPKVALPDFLLPTFKPFCETKQYTVFQRITP